MSLFAWSLLEFVGLDFGCNQSNVTPSRAFHSREGQDEEKAVLRLHFPSMTLGEKPMSEHKEPRLGYGDAAS
jgi:hypothetical protein